MTMHSAKGLSAHVVFIPGLEETLLPNTRSASIVGLVSEAARLLFVSITRARNACILSFSSRRRTQGTMMPRVPSRFCQHLGGAFISQTSGLQVSEVVEIVSGIQNM